MSKLGELLTTAREEREWTIADAANDTRIRPQYLEALEMGNYTDLPDEVCTVGFIRNYARALGLDPQETLEVYRTEAPERAAMRQIQSIEVPLSPETPVSFNLVIIVIIFLLVAVALAVAYRRYDFSLVALIPTPRPTATYTLTPRPTLTSAPSPTDYRTATSVPTKLISVKSEDDEPTRAASLTRSSSSAEPTDTARPTSTRIPTRTATAVTPTDTARPSPTRTAWRTDTPTTTPTARATYTPLATRTSAVATNTVTIEDLPVSIDQPALRVRLDIAERSWLRVVIDGEQVLEEILEPDQYRFWTATREVAIRSGNAGGVEVSLDDQEYGPLGERGQVVDMIWMKNDEEVWVQATPVAEE